MRFLVAFVFAKRGSILTLFQGYTVPINYCGEKKLNSPLSGEVPLISASLITFVDEPSLTAVAIDIVQSRYTVAFIGTEAGHLKKVRRR